MKRTLFAFRLQNDGALVRRDFLVCIEVHNKTRDVFNDAADRRDVALAVLESDAYLRTCDMQPP